jgi:hypothetical protein
VIFISELKREGGGDGYAVEKSRDSCALEKRV